MECIPIPDVLKRYDITKEELIALANNSGVFLTVTDTHICLTGFLRQQLERINKTMSILNEVGWVTRSAHSPIDDVIVSILKRKGVTVVRKGATVILSKKYVSLRYDEIAKMPSEIKQHIIYIDGVPFLRIDLYQKFLEFEKSRKEVIVIDVPSDEADMVRG